MSKKPIVIDYTLEEFMARKKREDKIINILDKMKTVMEKFQDGLILHNYRIKKLEKKKK
ncbi:hypothetical protein LCGC14_2737730 [marine sediment metagenome]|uniref:Uncharacterized protein n=1 Tax=marine sediment metagenome TaxID=412755 RepID=A0A0F9BX23_9ZZZZ